MSIVPHPSHLGFFVGRPSHGCLCGRPSSCLPISFAVNSVFCWGPMRYRREPQNGKFFSLAKGWSRRLPPRNLFSVRMDKRQLIGHCHMCHVHRLFVCVVYIYIHIYTFIYIYIWMQVSNTCIRYAFVYIHMHSHAYGCIHAHPSCICLYSYDMHPYGYVMHQFGHIWGSSARKTVLHKHDKID